MKREGWTGKDLKAEYLWPEFAYFSAVSAWTYSEVDSQPVPAPIFDTDHFPSDRNDN